jgi:hypothetical protein
MEKKQNMIVKVEEINVERNEVYLTDGQGSEGWFVVAVPANIKYAQIGKAEAGIIGTTVTYLKSLEPKKEGFSRSNSPMPRQQTPFYPKSFTSANPIVSGDKLEDAQSRFVGKSISFSDITLKEADEKIDALRRTTWIKAWQHYPRMLNGNSTGKYDIVITVMDKREEMGEGNTIPIFLPKEIIRDIKEVADANETTIEQAITTVFKKDTVKK